MLRLKSDYDKRKRNKRRALARQLERARQAKRKQRKCHVDTWRGPIGRERARRNDKYARRKVKKANVDTPIQISAVMNAHGPIVDAKNATDIACSAHSSCTPWIACPSEQRTSAAVDRIDERFTRANRRGEAEAEATAATATLEHYNSALGTGNIYKTNINTEKKTAAATNLKLCRHSKTIEIANVETGARARTHTNARSAMNELRWMRSSECLMWFR